MPTTTSPLAFDERRIDALLSEFESSRHPGAAVGIAIDGRAVYRQGFGVANMELPVVLSPTIRMRIASVSKHITALMYMLLCEDGDAKIDDPIGRYLPELDPISHKVTMLQLMGHTSGLHDVFEICHQFSGTTHSVTSEQLLSMYCSLSEVNAPPGTAWIYNNGGFLLLSIAIERITGKSLEDVLRERIFQPLGMYATLLRRYDTDYMPNSAAAHVTSPAGGYEKSNFFGTAWAGEGGIVSTVDDMLRWLAHMDSPIVGSRTTWEAMSLPQMLANGTSTGYGLGLVVGSYRGLTTFQHPGGGQGGSAHLLKIPDAKLGVVVLMNRDGVHAAELCERIVDACFPASDCTKQKSVYPLACGVFRSKKTDRVVQLIAKEGQQIASIDGYDLIVEPDADGTLSPAGAWRYYKQEISIAGDPLYPTSIRLCDFGNVDDLMRVPPENMNEDAILGCYRSDSTASEANIFIAASSPRLTTVGRFGSVNYRLENLAQGVWRARTTRPSYFGGILSFRDDGQGFRFYSSLCRMWGLRFRHVSREYSASATRI